MQFVKHIFYRFFLRNLFLLNKILLKLKFTSHKKIEKQFFWLQNTSLYQNVIRRLKYATSNYEHYFTGLLYTIFSYSISRLKILIPKCYRRSANELKFDKIIVIKELHLWRNEKVLTDGFAVM